MNTKKHPQITKAKLVDDDIVLEIKNREEKTFRISNLKKFSIRKVRSSKLVYYFAIILLPLAYIDVKLLWLLTIPFLWFIVSRKFYKKYKLILISTNGIKYTYTFNQDIRAQLFNMRVYVKYRMQT